MLWQGFTGSVGGNTAPDTCRAVVRGSGQSTDNAEDCKHASLFSASFRISRVEESAFRALREKLFAHTSALISAFKAYDKDNTGKFEPRAAKIIPWWDGVVEAKLGARHNPQAAFVPARRALLVRQLSHGAEEISLHVLGGKQGQGSQQNNFVVGVPSLAANHSKKSSLAVRAADNLGAFLCSWATEEQLVELHSS